MDIDLLPTNLVYFYKVRVPDCISLDSDSNSDSDATDINELCDDLANNPGVDGFFNSPLKQTTEGIICVSSDEEVELDQKWVKRVSGRSNSPVPLSMNTVQTSREPLPMVVLPPFARKSIEEAARKDKDHSNSVSNEEIIPESAYDTLKDKSNNFSNCVVMIKPLSQDDIEKFTKDNKKIKKSRSHNNEKILNIQEKLRNVCDNDSDSDSNIPLSHWKAKKKNKTRLECDRTSDTKLTIRRKSVDDRVKRPESDNMTDQSYFPPRHNQQKRKIMTRRHSVYESKSDSSKEKKDSTEIVNVPTRIVPKRRASMSNNVHSPPSEKKIKKAIVIEALPNKQLRQRSNYNEAATIQISPIEKARSKTASDEKLKRDRNEKIRQVAENQSNRMSVDEPSTSHRVKNITKPVAKMTLNNRGLFLTERIQRYAPTTNKTISKTTIVTNAPPSSTDFKITIQRFRKSHLQPDTLSTDIEGVCNNVQFYKNINDPNSENSKTPQRKLTITLDEEELEHQRQLQQRQLQQTATARFYEEMPIVKPTYSPSEAANPFIKNVYSSPIPSTSSKVPLIPFQTPKNQTIQLKSILTPNTSTKVNKDKRVSFNEVLVTVREIPKINQTESDDEESLKEYYDVPDETIEPIEKILYEILSWCPSWLDNKRGELNRPKNWTFQPMLQSYESLNQYKNILSPIMNMELLSNIKSKYDAIMTSHKHKWTTFKKLFCSKQSSSLFCIQVTGELKENRKNYTVGSLMIMRINIQQKETKFFGYICEPLDRNNTFKVQCCNDDINYSLASSESKVDIMSIMYLRSELKSLMSLNQLTETGIMMKVLKPESNKVVVSVEPNVDGILRLNTSQADICCRIVEDLITNKDAKVIALQGGPGTGKTKVIVACIMKIIKRSNNCKILICSKSNACINEITVLLSSLSIENRIRLVRFGNQDRMSEAVAKVSLLHLAHQHLKKTNDISFVDSKMAVIENADVVCTTINSSYDLINDYKKHFDVCFIDEASQFTDSDLIIPVKCGFRKLVLVGDSKQLQPIINAKELKGLNFETTLLERMNKICSKRNPVLTLKIQHRMNPEIFKFPNQYFYNNEITTSLLHPTPIPVKPYMVFGLKYDQNMTQDTSSYNTGEIKFCYHLCDSLLTIIPPNLTIAIITPYSRQRGEVLKYFK